MLARGDEALVGQLLGDRYRVTRVIGAGCTGTVFAVEHATLGRSFALKVLRPRTAPAEFVLHVFENDVLAAARVAHPALVDLVDAGTVPDGAPYFVTPYLEGETLAARLERGPLMIDAAVDLTLQLLSAIGRVHQEALLLRDLRPQNLFLVARRGGAPLLKLLDFGLTRLLPLDRTEGSWRTPELVTAAHYLSPERTRGETGIGPASDLFIASAILYEALSGTRAFTSTSFAGLLEQIANAEHVPLQSVRRDVPQSLAHFVSRGLACEPDERFASAEEMQDALRALFPESPPSLDDDDDTRGTGRPASDPARIPLGRLGIPRLTGDDDEQQPFFAQIETPLDEASADNTDRTVPPPSHEFDIPALGDRQTSGEEETWTTKLGPEARALAAGVVLRAPRPAKK